MSKTRFASSVVLTCAVFAVTLPGCTSDQSGGVGDVEMTVTLATPPAGPNEQIDDVDVSFWCEGDDPVLGTPRPPKDDPEMITINTATSQGPEPKNTIGLFEKQGLPAGDCHFSFFAVSNSGATECTGDLTLTVQTNQTTEGTVIVNCIHTPRYGGVRVDGTFNQCAEYRQIFVGPLTQAIGNLVDVRTEVYDPDGDLVTVGVQAVGACSNVMYTNGQTAASCEDVSGCEAVAATAECTDVGLCQIIVAVTDDGFDGCNGLLPDGSNNDGARQTIDVDCTIASGCGNGEFEPPEDCDPPDGIFCDENCQLIDNCEPNPCDQTDVCSPQDCTGDLVDNTPICTPNPGSAVGVTCSPPAGGSCDGLGACVACTEPTDCDDLNDCTDNDCQAGACVFTPDDTNMCDVAPGVPGSCNGGDCDGLCTGTTCPDNGIECVTATCDALTGDCTGASNDGINTGCNLDGAGAATGVCTGLGACVECNTTGQCTGDDTCEGNVCTPPSGPPTYDLSNSIFKAYNSLLGVNTIPGTCIGGVFDGSGPAQLLGRCRRDSDCPGDPDAMPPVPPGVCDVGNGTPANDCLVPEVSGVPGGNITGVETQCTIVEGEPDITGSMVVTERTAEPGVWDMDMTQNLLFTINLSVQIIPGLFAQAIIQTDSVTVFDGVADGAAPGSLDFREFMVDTETFNVNASATGTVFCCADTNDPPNCDPPDYGNAAGTLCGAVPPLAPGFNQLPLAGDPGARAFPNMTVKADGSWEFGDGAPSLNGWYIVNPAPMSSPGTQFAALAGVQN